MDEPQITKLKHMQTTGKDIAAIFARSIDSAQIPKMSEALIALSQSIDCHEARMMILGALAALGHGALEPSQQGDTTK